MPFDLIIKSNWQWLGSSISVIDFPIIFESSFIFIPIISFNGFVCNFAIGHGANIEVSCSIDFNILDSTLI